MHYRHSGSGHSPCLGFPSQHFLQCQEQYLKSNAKWRLPGGGIQRMSHNARDLQIPKGSRGLGWRGRLGFTALSSHPLSPQYYPLITAVSTDLHRGQRFPSSRPQPTRRVQCVGDSGLLARGVRANCKCGLGNCRRPRLHPHGMS